MDISKYNSRGVSHAHLGLLRLQGTLAMLFLDASLNALQDILNELPIIDAKKAGQFCGPPSTNLEL